jgi:drug/metabolite transporter (DMT)-like permease
MTWQNGGWSRIVLSRPICSISCSPLHDLLEHTGKTIPLIDIVLFAAYTASSVIGLLLLKYALPLARIDWQTGVPAVGSLLLVASGACLYIASFAVWLVILARHELSTAYPAAIGLTLAFSTIGAALALGEPLSPPRLLGIIVIFVGILLVTRY